MMNWFIACQLIACFIPLSQSSEGISEFPTCTVAVFICIIAHKFLMEDEILLRILLVCSSQQFFSLVQMDPLLSGIFNYGSKCQGHNMVALGLQPAPLAQGSNVLSLIAITSPSPNLYLNTLRMYIGSYFIIIDRYMESVELNFLCSFVHTFLSSYISGSTCVHGMLEGQDHQKI